MIGKLTITYRIFYATKNKLSIKIEFLLRSANVSLLTLSQ
jgi:hypothetical protein